jgi:LPPG:FO 2-phospho-L-lactate transferase
VNTGDDFQHWGLHISPDLDTVMYALAGLSPEDRAAARTIGFGWETATWSRTFPDPLPSHAGTP